MRYTNRCLPLPLSTYTLPTLPKFYHCAPYYYLLNYRVADGATKNARPENAGRSKMQGWKMRDLKIRHQYQYTGVENAGPENAAPKCRSGKCGTIKYGKLFGD